MLVDIKIIEKPEIHTKAIFKLSDFDNDHKIKESLAIIFMIAGDYALDPEIEIEDLTFDKRTKTFYYPCPCGDKFAITIQQMKDSFEIAMNKDIYYELTTILRNSNESLLKFI